MGRRRRRANYNIKGLIVLGFLCVASYIGKLLGIGLIGACIIIGVIGISIIIYFKYLERQRYLQSGIAEIDNMSGIEFEKCLKHHFNRLGYKADTTSKSHDYGADLIMRNGSEKMLT